MRTPFHGRQKADHHPLNQLEQPSVGRGDELATRRSVPRATTVDFSSSNNTNTRRLIRVSESSEIESERENTRSPSDSRSESGGSDLELCRHCLSVYVGNHTCNSENDDNDNEQKKSLKTNYYSPIPIQLNLFFLFR